MVLCAGCGLWLVRSAEDCDSKQNTLSYFDFSDRDGYYDWVAYHLCRAQLPALRNIGNSARCVFHEGRRRQFALAIVQLGQDCELSVLRLDDYFEREHPPTIVYDRRQLAAPVCASAVESFANRVAEVQTDENTDLEGVLWTGEFVRDGRHEVRFSGRRRPFGRAKDSDVGVIRGCQELLDLVGPNVGVLPNLDGTSTSNVTDD
jgi:hypothetical protein